MGTGLAVGRCRYGASCAHEPVTLASCLMIPQGPREAASPPTSSQHLLAQAQASQVSPHCRIWEVQWVWCAEPCALAWRVACLEACLSLHWGRLEHSGLGLPGLGEGLMVSVVVPASRSRPHVPQPSQQPCDKDSAIPPQGQGRRALEKSRLTWQG